MAVRERATDERAILERAEAHYTRMFASGTARQRNEAADYVRHCRAALAQAERRPGRRRAG